MPLPELGVQLGPKRAAHLLRRASFGPTIDDIRTFATKTPVEAIDLLFTANIPDPVPPIDPATGTEWFSTPVTGANSKDNFLQEYFKGWFLAQMLSAGVNPTQSLAYSVREKVVFFLHTHFTCIQEKVNNSRAMYFQNQLLRQFALDSLPGVPAEVNIKELTVKISIDNAMLRLLDGWSNVKGGVNENYARELLELYTIGRGFEFTLPEPVEAGDYIVYKEADVQAAAKVLSGWDLDEEFLTIDEDTELPRGRIKGSPTNASAHDNTVKQFSDRFANATIAPDPLLLNGGNPTEESALDEIRQLIDLIYAQEETAMNICRKIYRFYCWAPHTETEAVPIDNAIITTMANTLISNGFKIQPVIENLLRSTHFYEGGGPVADDNFGAIIKSPIDLLVGTFRLFNVQLPDMTTQPVEFYEATGLLIARMDKMGLKFFQPFDVSGYDAYHQFPIYHRAWITVNYLTNRYNFIRELTNEEHDAGMFDMFKVNVYEFVKNNFSDAVASDAPSLVKELAMYLLPVNDALTFDDAADDASGLTSLRLNYFKARLVDLFPEEYWTTRWNLQEADLRTQLEFLFNAIMQSPEYQLA